MTVTLLSPPTLRKQGKQTQRSRNREQRGRGFSQGGGFQNWALNSGLLSTNQTLDTVLGTGDAMVNDTSPCPRGADLLWGRGIPHKSAREQQSHSQGLGGKPFLSLLAGSGDATRTLLSFLPPTPKVALSPFPEAPDQNSRPPRDAGTVRHAPFGLGDS